MCKDIKIFAHLQEKTQKSVFFLFFLVDSKNSSTFAAKLNKNKHRN